MYLHKNVRHLSSDNILPIIFSNNVLDTIKIEITKVIYLKTHCYVGTASNEEDGGGEAVIGNF